MVAEFAATGSVETSWFQTLSAGKKEQAGAAPSGAAIGVPAPAVRPASATIETTPVVMRIPICTRGIGRGRAMLDPRTGGLVRLRRMAMYDADPIPTRRPIVRP